MRDEEDTDTRLYSVVVNHEEQYSIWLADREPPSGWTRTGTPGTKDACLEHIKQVWTDMRPLSLRQKIAEWERELAAHPPLPVEDEGPGDGVDDLVRRLSVAQPVEVSLRPARTLDELRAACDRGYVHIKFVQTGTELGVRLSRSDCDLGALSSPARGTRLRLSGELALNYNRVRLRCTVDAETFTGEGALEFIEALSPGQAWAPSADAAGRSS